MAESRLDRGLRRRFQNGYSFAPGRRTVVASELSGDSLARQTVNRVNKVELPKVATRVKKPGHGLFVSNPDGHMYNIYADALGLPRVSPLSDPGYYEKSSLDAVKQRVSDDFLYSRGYASGPQGNVVSISEVADPVPSVVESGVDAVDWRARMLADEKAREQAAVDDWIAALTDVYAGERAQLEQVLGGPLDTSLLDENLAVQLEQLGFRGDAASSAIRAAYADAGVESQRIADQIVASQMAEAARAEAMGSASSGELAALNDAVAGRSSSEFGANMGVGGAASDAVNAILADAGLDAADIRNNGNAQANSVLARAAMYDRDAADQLAAMNNLVVDRQFDLSEAYRSELAARDYDRQMRLEQAIVDSINNESAAKAAARGAAAELGLTESELEILIRNEQFTESLSEVGGGSARSAVVPDSPARVDFSSVNVGPTGEPTVIRLDPNNVRSQAALLASLASEAASDGEAVSTAVAKMLAEMRRYLEGEIAARTPDGAPLPVITDEDVVSYFVGDGASAVIPSNLRDALSLQVSSYGVPPASNTSAVDAFVNNF